MSHKRIEEIEARLQYVKNACAFDIPASNKLVFIDVPYLLAEVERLRGVAADLARGVRSLEESFDDADERRPKWLQAALDAAEGVAT